MNNLRVLLPLWLNRSPWLLLLRCYFRLKASVDKVICSKVWCSPTHTDTEAGDTTPTPCSWSVSRTNWKHTTSTQVAEKLSNGIFLCENSYAPGISRIWVLLQHERSVFMLFSHKGPHVKPGIAHSLLLPCQNSFLTAQRGSFVETKLSQEHRKTEWLYHITLQCIHFTQSRMDQHSDGLSLNQWDSASKDHKVLYNSRWTRWGQNQTHSAVYT